MLSLDLSTGILLAVVTLLAMNRVIFFGKEWYRAQWRFWTVQLVNLTAACALAIWGIPDFEGPMRILPYMFTGLLVLHIVQNNRKLQRAWDKARAESGDERSDQREAFLAKMKGAGEE